MNPPHALEWEPLFVAVLPEKARRHRLRRWAATVGLVAQRRPAALRLTAKRRPAAQLLVEDAEGVPGLRQPGTTIRAGRFRPGRRLPPARRVSQAAAEPALGVLRRQATLERR